VVQNISSPRRIRNIRSIGPCPSYSYTALPRVTRSTPPVRSAVTHPDVGGMGGMGGPIEGTNDSSSGSRGGEPGSGIVEELRVVRGLLLPKRCVNYNIYSLLPVYRG
jgi:hypothetical protein